MPENLHLQLAVKSCKQSATSLETRLATITHISSRSYRSVPKEGVTINFKEDKPHVIIIGGNGTGKTNVIKSFFDGERSTSDIPLDENENNYEVRIGCSYMGWSAEKVLHLQTLEYRIEIDDKIKQELFSKVNKIKDQGYKTQARAFLKNYEKMQVNHSWHRLKFLHPNDNGHLQVLFRTLKEISFEFITNLDEQCSSLWLSADKYEAPDQLFNFIVESLGENDAESLKKLLNFEQISAQEKTRLRRQLDNSLEELSSPLKGIKLQISEFMDIDQNNGMKIMVSSENHQIDIVNKSDGEILMISFLLFLHEKADKNQPEVIFIDEIEKSYDPKAQFLITKLISQCKKNLHFILTTHSPYIFFGEEILKTASLNIAKREHFKTRLEEVDTLSGRVLNYKSWSELNYLAYSIPSIEYHNELFGQLCLETEKQLDDLDQYLKAEGFPLSQYIRSQRDNPAEAVVTHCKHAPNCNEHKEGAKQGANCLTISTKIRNLTHHSENELNLGGYSQKDLEDSIDLMVALLKKIQSEKN